MSFTNTVFDIGGYWQMKHSVSRAFALMAVALLAASCATSGSKDGRDAGEPLPPPPAIKQDMPLTEALEAGINYGGDTLADVKRLIKRRREGGQAGQILEKALNGGLGTYQHNQLLNAAHLYMFTPAPLSEALFIALVRSDRPLAHQLGWQLAATKSTPLVAKMIERELTRAIADNDEESVLLPQMANAIAANHLKGSYTFARRGLMVKGDEEFAAAMARLNSKQASEDFLTYLAQAPGEELRQLTVSSVNMYTCLAILRHMRAVPPSVANVNFPHLFFYAVSRNVALAELAQGVLQTYIPTYTENLAQMLARHPNWTQIAYLESARRKMTPQAGLLLSELKKVTAEQSVVQEISELKF